MAQILKRTPTKGTTDVVRPGRQSRPKHVEMFAKSMRITLVGDSKEHLQAVAAAAHKAMADHDAVKGGKTGKRVHITCDSSVPTKIFDGTILRTDNVD